MELSKKQFEHLVELMQRDGLDRLHIRTAGIDLDLCMSPPHAHGPASAEPAGAKTETLKAQPEEPPANVQPVLAPLVGVFYRAPAPGAKPFVEVGDAVSEGQVLCIIEAMKLMNQIVSDHDGMIVRICADEGALVSVNQELFWIQT